MSTRQERINAAMKRLSAIARDLQPYALFHLLGTLSVLEPVNAETVEDAVSTAVEYAVSMAARESVQS